MSGTFSQLFIELVFAVEGIKSLVLPSWEKQMHDFMREHLETAHQKVLAIGGDQDHVHIILNYRPSVSVANLVQQVKVHTTLFVHRMNLTELPFYWQEGYGAFSLGIGDVSEAVRRVEQQKNIHVNLSFEKEYKSRLREYQIPFKEEYLFHWLAFKPSLWIPETQVKLPGQR